MATICDDAIKLAEERYKTVVYAVVSDNAANMIAMGKKLPQYHSTCNSHTGNLLAKDLVDKNIANRVVSVLKEFKRNELEQLSVCRLKHVGAATAMHSNASRKTFQS